MVSGTKISAGMLDAALWCALGVAAVGAGVSAGIEAASRWGDPSAMAAAGAAAIAVIAAGVGIAARVMSGRDRRAVSAIWSALHDLSVGVFGDQDTEALLLDADFGDEAGAWNDLIRQRGEREAIDAEREALEAMNACATGGTGGGDLLDMLPQGVLVIGVGGRVECTNAAASLFLRKTRDALNGCSLVECGLDASVLELVDGLRGGGSGARRGSVEVKEEGDTDHGPSVLRFSARRSGRGEAGSIVVVIDDVTQQRLADESRSTLLASAAHELRTPLTNVRLWIEEYIDAAEDDDETRSEAINVITQESRRLERIVNDVLSVSELEAGSIRLQTGDIRLDALFKEIESDFRAQADEKQITLKLDLPPRLPVIEGDRDRFELVMHNLVGNALKYTPDRGEVTLSIGETESDIAIEIRDTGFGIDESEHERVFERFYRANDERVDEVTGTGLGLSISREVIRRHGGDITLESALNKGSTFTVRMPKRHVAAAKAA